MTPLRTVGTTVPQSEHCPKMTHLAFFQGKVLTREMVTLIIITPIQVGCKLFLRQHDAKYAVQYAPLKGTTNLLVSFLAGVLVHISDNSDSPFSKSTTSKLNNLSVSQNPSIASITSNGSMSGTSTMFGNLSHISGPWKMSATQERFSLNQVDSRDMSDDVFDQDTPGDRGGAGGNTNNMDWDKLLNDAQFVALSLKVNIYLIGPTN